MEAFFHCPKIRKIIGSQNFPLDNSKIDFNLIKRAGMNGQVNRSSIWPFLFERFNKGLSSMRKTIIDNPKDPLGCSVGCLGHTSLGWKLAGKCFYLCYFLRGKSTLANQK